jgi:hypothetical protein
MNANKILTPKLCICRSPAFLSKIRNQTKYITKFLRINSIRKFCGKKTGQLATTFRLEVVEASGGIHHITLNAGLVCRDTNITAITSNS